MVDSQFKSKSDIHWARKVWHVVGVLLIAFAFSALPRQWALIYIYILAFLSIFIDIARLKNPSINRVALKVMGPFIRESERNSLAGTTHLLTACVFVFTFTPPSVGLLALLFLAIADPVASLVGLLYGKDKIINNKTIQGTLGAFVICFIISYLYFYSHGLLVERIFLASFIAALIGALSEVIPLGPLDDNFTLPVLSSIGIWALFIFFGAL